MVTKGILKTAKLSADTMKKMYHGLEYGGLGALTALDLHDAYKAHKEGDKSGVKKGLAGAGALGALMGATHLASKVHK